jgi:heat-inducible transcriptional repressor
VLSLASHELSRVSNHVGFALASAETGTLARIEFVPLEGSRILVVVVSTNGDVVHKVITFDAAVTRDELIQSANYLTQEFSGLTLAAARSQVIERMQAERALYDELLARSLRLASATLAALPFGSLVFVTGTPTLIDDGLNEDALPTLRTLLAMIEEKDRLVRLLTAYMEAPGLMVVIGSEHTAPDLQSLSLVATTYVDGPRTGAIGVIGPTRMRYSRAIAAVESVSHAMQRVLASD